MGVDFAGGVSSALGLAPGDGVMGGFATFFMLGLGVNSGCMGDRSN